MSAPLVIKIPLKVHVSGFLTLGPRPGTPEFVEEQDARLAGRPYDYSKGQRLYITDEPAEPALVFSVSDDVEPPDEGVQG